MPKISGFEVCKKIKAMFHPYPPPVILLTGKIDSIDPIKGRSVGADDFVVKTSDMSHLIQGVRKVFTL